MFLTDSLFLMFSTEIRHHGQDVRGGRHIHDKQGDNKVLFPCYPKRNISSLNLTGGILFAHIKDLVICI